MSTSITGQGISIYPAPDDALSSTSKNPVQNKVIDEELSDVKNALEYNGIGNAFDGQFYNGYWSSTGVLTSASNIDVCCATKIPCPENADVVLKTNTSVTGYAIYISYFDEAGTTRLRRDVTSSALYEGVSPVGTHWFAFTYEKSGITKDNFGTAELYINNKIDKIVEEISDIKAGDFADGSVTIPKTSFLSIEIGNNLHNAETDKNGVWYTASGNNVIEQTNQYTTGYTAVLVELPEQTQKITVSSDYAYAYLYNYFTGSSKETPTAYLSSGTPATYIRNGYTINVPDGATALFMSFQNISGFNVMVNVGESALPFVPYSKAYLLEGNEIAFNESSESVLKLPDTFNAVVGDTFELFYKGIANVVDPTELEFDVTAETGKAFSKKYIVTPTAAGTERIFIAAKNNDGKIMGTGAFDLVTVAVPSSPGTQKNVLCIGDSLTQDGIWCAETDRRLTGNGGSPAGNGLTNISFIGTKHNGATGYEGHGGWTINSYLSSMVSDAYMIINGSFDKTEADQHSIYKDANNKQWKLETIGATQLELIRVSDSGTLPASGTLTWVSGGVNTDAIIYTSSEQAPANPFWNSSENKIDFSSYATSLGVTSIDYAIIFLGWNSTGATETDYKDKFTQFIGALHAAFPDCKVVLLGLQVPSRDGLANNYGTTWKYYSTLQNVWKINKWYCDLAETLPNVSYLNIAGQFDSEHSYPTTQMHVNTRSTETEYVQSNGVHPNTFGKYQIADAVYRKLCAML